MANVTKICFFGPSGSGKTTAMNMAYGYLASELGNRSNTLFLNVSTPLHSIQNDIYKKLNLPNISQDGQLLQFLVEHFGIEVLLVLFKKELNRFLLENEDADKPLFILNSDCRNNAYDTLKEHGFIFIKVMTDYKIRAERLGERQDMSRADLNKKYEQTSGMIEDYIIYNNGKKWELREEVKNTMEHLLII